jgi:hypothetical protein
MPKKIRELISVRQVVDVVGRARLQRLTNRRTNNLTNWLTNNRMPPDTFLIVSAELESKHCRARPALFGITAPRKSTAA